MHSPGTGLLFRSVVTSVGARHFKACGTGCTLSPRDPELCAILAGANVANASMRVHADEATEGLFPIVSALSSTPCPSSSSNQRMTPQKSSLLPFADIDSKTHKTSTYDPTYAMSFYRSQRERETLYLASLADDGGKIQTEITEKMRVILIDWLVSISESHKFGLNTYCLAVHLMDYALTLMPIRRSEFQLLGCTCMWLAAKLEEMCPPMAENLLFVSANCFDANALVQMEQKLVTLLGYKPLIPTRNYFSTRFGRAAGLSDKEQALANYLVEVSLFDASLSSIVASKVAAAALLLAMHMAAAHLPRSEAVVPQESLWSRSLEHYSGYREEELVELVLQLRALHFYFEENENHKNIIKKWEKPARHRVAHVFALRLEDLHFASSAARSVSLVWRENDEARAKAKEEAKQREETARDEMDAPPRKKDARHDHATGSLYFTPPHFDDVDDDDDGDGDGDGEEDVVFKDSEGEEIGEEEEKVGLKTLS